MDIKLRHIEPEDFLELKKTWEKSLKDNLMPEEIVTKEDIEIMMRLLFYIQNDIKQIVGPLKEIGIINEIQTNEISHFEKCIQTIAKNDQIDKIMAPKGENKKKNWMGNRLQSFLSHFISAENKGRTEVVAKTLYNKYRKAIMMRISRLKNSPKVVEIVNKHPDVDVHSLVSLGMISGKIELTHDDLLWIDQMITLIKAKP